MNKGEFTTLLTRYLKRTDLTDLYDDWLVFTSSRIDQQLRLKEQEIRWQVVPTEQFTDLPADFIEARHIESNGRPLEYATPGQLDRLRAQYRDSFSPYLFYTITDNQLEIAPAPTVDSEAEIEMFYYAKLPALSSDADTNKVLTAYPQLYLYGCMMESAAMREAPDDAAAYSQLWRDYAKELNDRQQAARFSGDSIQMRAG